MTGDVRDAHNAISLGVDGDGVLHLAWDHHGGALRYARGVAPGSLELGDPQPMTGRNENQLAVDDGGGWHLSWTWRESWDVATNHDILSAHSPDQGATWRRSTGEAYALPITQATAEVAVATPQGSGLINQTTMTADRAGRPTSTSPDRDDWGVRELYRPAVGLWEPVHDAVAWKRWGELHLLVQRVGQGEGGG